MHLRWNRRQLLSNRQTGESLCTHHEVARPWTLAPALIHQNRSIWYLGPSIRECCLEDESELAIAAWWWEVRNRFEDLSKIGLADHEVTRALLQQLDLIEELLEERVPKPTKGAWKRYEAHRQMSGTKGRRQKLRVAPEIALLGLTWPCTPQDIKSRWRAIALEHHPDRGGNVQTFIELKAAYDKVAAMVIQP